MAGGWCGGIAIDEVIIPIFYCGAWCSGIEIDVSFDKVVYLGFVVAVGGCCGDIKVEAAFDDIVRGDVRRPRQHLHRCIAQR